jgi:hypothetical protein
MPIVLNEGEDRLLNIMLTVKAPPIPQLASLYGYVKDADTGEGIIGATVELIGYYSTVTDTEGYYILTNIEPGTYNIKVSHPNYNDYVD